MRACSNEIGVLGSTREPATTSESRHETAGADELISDLAALLDAGLVVVHEHVLGPPRYGIARHPAMIGGAVVD